jgi:hypothetical protein
VSWQQNRNLSQQLAANTTDVFTAPQLIPPTEIFVSEFSLDGAGVSDDMAIDGSTPKKFQVVCPADKVIILSMGEWHVADAGIEPELFGGISALGNGVVVSVHDADDSVLASFTPITHNIMWAHLGAIETSIIWQGATTDQLTIRWEMTRSIGYGIYLTPGQYIQTLVQDNLAALDHFEGTMHGRQIDA